MPPVSFPVIPQPGPRILAEAAPMATMLTSAPKATATNTFRFTAGPPRIRSNSLEAKRRHAKRRLHRATLAWRSRHSIEYALATMPTGRLSAAPSSMTRPKQVLRPMRTTRASATTSKLTGRRKWVVWSIVLIGR